MQKLYVTVAALALTAGGAAWAETAATPVVPPAQTATDAAKQAVDAAGKAVDAAAEATEKAADAAGEAASDAAKATADAAAEATDAAKAEVKDAAAATEAAAKDAAAATEAVATDAAQATKDAAAATSDAAKDAAAATDAAVSDVVTTDMAAATVTAPEGTLATWIINRAIWTTEQPAGSSWDAYADLKERPAEWKSIAKVEDMVIAQDGKVTGYVADIGGFLGIGSKRVLLAPDALRLMTVNNDTFFATHYTEEELKTLPDFKAEVVQK